MPEGLTNIGVGVFREYRSLKKLEIPDSVVSIGDAAFDRGVAYEFIIRIHMPKSI